MAAITNYYKLGGFKTTETYFLTALEAKSLKLGVLAGPLPLKALGRILSCLLQLWCFQAFLSLQLHNSSLNLHLYEFFLSVSSPLLSLTRTFCWIRAHPDNLGWSHLLKSLILCLQRSFFSTKSLSNMYFIQHSQLFLVKELVSYKLVHHSQKFLMYI